MIHRKSKFCFCVIAYTRSSTRIIPYVFCSCIDCTKLSSSESGRPNTPKWRSCCAVEGLGPIPLPSFHQIASDCAHCNPHQLCLYYYHPIQYLTGLALASTKLKPYATFLERLLRPTEGTKRLRKALGPLMQTLDSAMRVRQNLEPKHSDHWTKLGTIYESVFHVPDCQTTVQERA
jgi:hypothetical protein